MRKLCNAIVATTIMTATIFTPLQAQAQNSIPVSSTTVNQGDKLVMGTSACTAGYIDKANNRVITAAHCGSPGDVVYRGDSSGKYQRIGILEKNDNHNLLTSRNDYNYVKLDKGVTGNNIYSGDTQITPQDVAVGDRFCSIGQKSPIVKCGVVKNIDGNMVVTNREGGGIKGDSGGPGWVPGKGFFGVYSVFWGENEYPTVNHRYNGSVFTYPEYSDNESRVRLNTGIISFTAPQILSPDKADPVTPSTTRENPSPTSSRQTSPTPSPKTRESSPTPSPKSKDPYPTPDIKSTPTPTPKPIQTPPQTDTIGSSASAIVGILVSSLALFGLGSAAYNLYREDPQLFDINYWIDKYFTF